MAIMAMTTRSSIKVNARRRVSFLNQASDLASLTFLINCSRLLPKSTVVLGFVPQISHRIRSSQLCVSRHTLALHRAMHLLQFNHEWTRINTNEIGSSKRFVRLGRIPLTVSDAGKV